MPSSTIRTFTDPDAYAAAVRATTSKISVMESGRFTAKLVRIDLHRLWMQYFSDSLPRIAHSANMAGRAIISFYIDPGPNIFGGGLEMLSNSITRFRDADAYYHRTSGSSSYASMSLPVEDMAAASVIAQGNRVNRFPPPPDL